MEITEKMKEEIIASAKSYVKAEQEEAFRAEVEKSLSENNIEDLYDRFYTSLAFGTAGMRGVIGGGTNRINSFMVRKVTQGLAEYLNKNSKSPSCTIAYDSRLYSQEFALSAAKVLAANGVKTYLYDTLHPVPMLSYAVRHLGTTAGIVVTASHNPSKYNGYKVYWSDGGQVTPPHDIEIAKLANAVKAENIKDISEKEARETGLLLSVPSDVDESYYSMVLNSMRRPELFASASVKAAYTPLHGTGNIPVRHILSTLGLDVSVVKEQELPDGHFPTVKLPNPESREAMTKVIDLAKSIKADIVLGTDPDADRLGIAIPKNKDKSEYLLLTGNQIATLLADYLLMSAKETGREGTPLIAKSLVTTDIIRKIAEANGAVCHDVLTGFKYIAEEIEKIDSGKAPGMYFLFGCEESYGFLTVKDVHDKDAVSSAVAAAEMMVYYASKGKTLKERLDEIYDEYGFATEIVFSADYEGAEGKVVMKNIMASLRSKASGDILAGRKISSVTDLLNEGTGFPKADVIIYKFESGEKLVIRPSGTEPKIKYYLFLSGDRSEIEKNADRIKEEFRKAL